MAAEIKRTAQAVWKGDSRSGEGRMSSASGALKDTRYSYSTRFEGEPGTNPEELVAAAHAGCFSMAFASALNRKGHPPERLETQATCIMTRPEGASGWRITKMVLEVQGKVAGVDQAVFEQTAHEAERGCPISNALNPAIEIELHATLL